MRPASIVNFERLYLLAIVVGLVNTFRSWSDAVAMVQSQPSIHLGQGFVIAATVIVLTIQLLLWYFIARQPSVVAKWIFVILAGLFVLSVIISFRNGAALNDISVLLGILNVVLRGLALWMLFRPDARGWFAGDQAPTIISSNN